MTQAVRRAILVAGTHRSGTSALAGTLARLGVALGSDLLPPSKDNERGYFEHAGVVEIHERLMESLDSTWDEWRPLPEGWQASDAARRARQELGEVLRADFSSARVFGVKDPRICRFLPLWIDLLQEHGCRPLIAIVVRHPIEVARSLERRDGLTAGRALLLWLDHLLAAEANSRGLERVLVTYSDLLSDWRRQIERMREAGSLDWPRRLERAASEIEQFLSPALRHHTSDGAQLSSLPDMVSRAYAAVLEKRDLDDPGLRSSLDALRRQLTGTARLFSAEALSASAPLRQRNQELEQGLRAAREEFDRELGSFRQARLAFWMDLAEERSNGTLLRLELAALKRRHDNLRQLLEAAREHEPGSVPELEPASPTPPAGGDSAVLRQMEIFQAHWIGDAILPSLVVAGRCVAPSGDQAVSLELRCDGVPLATTDCPEQGFRIETSFPISGDRFDLVDATTGSLLATRHSWQLWPTRQRNVYAAFCHNHRIRPHLKRLLTSAQARFERRPGISVLIIDRRSVPDVRQALAATIASLEAQIYPEWQVVVASEESLAERLALPAHLISSRRLAQVTLEDGAGACRLSNAAARNASGEWVCWLYPGDLLAPQALFEVAWRLQSESAVHLIYSDHDAIDSMGERSEPRLKPDWSPIFLLGHDYVDRAVFVRRSMLTEIGGWRMELPDAELYDLLLRLAEQAGDAVHIPHVLFHFRQITDRSAESASAMRQARRSALERRAIDARLEPNAAAEGFPESFEWPDQGPSVTIVIPTFNQHQLLRQCIESIRQRTSYRDYDLLIVDNDSDDPETLEYLHELAARPKTRILRIPRIDGRFSFSRINNAAAEAAGADYLLLLNNDTEIIEPNWLSRLMGHACLPGVGAVGARLLYPDDSLQHAGVALAMNEGSLPGHLFYRHPAGRASYLHLAEACREVSAVTGACLLTPRRLFLEMGGLDDENLPVVFNDADYCLRLAVHGLKTVYAGSARLRHLESASRSQRDEPSQLVVFRQRHGASREHYTSPRLARWLGRDLRVNPRCALACQRFFERPLRVLWVFPDTSGDAGGPMAEAMAATAAEPWLESVSGMLDDGPGFDDLRRSWSNHQTLTTHIRTLRDLLQRQRPDVLVAGSFESFPFVLAASVAAVPSVWRLAEHLTPGDLDQRMPEPARVLVDQALAAAGRVVFASRHTFDLWHYLDARQNFESLAGAPRAWQTAGVEARTAREQLHLPAGKVLLLSPVGVGPVERWGIFFEAIRILAETRDDFLVLLLAEPAALATLVAVRARLRKLGLEHLFADVEPTAPIDLCHQAADALVIGSTRSLRPEVLLRAMAHRLPLVSGEPWSLGELVQGANAVICEPKDPPGLAEALDRLLSDASLRQQLGASSRTLLDTFPDLPDVGKELAKLIAEAWQTGPQNGPRFVVLVAIAEDPPQSELKATIESLRRQTYPTWELCALVPAGSSVADFLTAASRFEHRLSVRHVEGADHLATAMNEVWQSLDEAWIGVLDAGDVLAPYALDEIAAYLEGHLEGDLVHADETHATTDGVRFRLKPAWSPDTLIGELYPGRPWFARTDLLRRIGGFHDGYGSAVEWDLMLRASEAGARALRLPLPCCHRRRVAAGDEASGRKAVRDHLRRLGLEAEVVSPRPGRLRAVWPVAGEPLVSIIIPNRDRADLLRQCLGGLIRRTGYQRQEILIVDNGSTEPEVLELYDSLTRQGSATILPFDQPFNYSVACNLAARQARGELLLFLNNDVEVLDRDWLEEMIRWTALPGVGIVGCKLVYPDARIQHAGITLGLNGLSGHLFYGAPEEDSAGPFGSADQYRNPLAVTGACQLMPRAVFDGLGGFDERYELIYSDVDLCLRAWQRGYRVVYTPFARLLHHEGSTRFKQAPWADEHRFARLLKSLDLASDRFFHPGLHGSNPRPEIRRTDEPGAANILQWWLKHLADDGPLLNVRDRRPLQRFLKANALELAIPAGTSAGLEELEDGAARFALGTLLEDADLYRRFPDALSGGEQGGYCRWLCHEKADELGLSDTARERLRTVFAQPPGNHIRRLLANRPSLLRIFPLAPTPLGQRGFLLWLIDSGRHELDLSDASIWWFSLQTWEASENHLLDVYLMQADWQRRFPDAATAPGWPTFIDWLAEQYPAAASWLRGLPPPAVLRSQPKPGATQPGINVIANFCYPSGVQQAALASVEALELAGYATSCRDLPTEENPLRAADIDRWSGFLGLERFDTTLLHVQPDLLSNVYEMAGLAPRADTRRVGVWYWELESPPPESWVEAASLLGELWAPTRFIAEALRKVMPIPVVTMPPGVPPPVFHARSRRDFGLDPEAFLFYFSFDTLSITERKNPLGLIRAFRRAFDPSEKAGLVIKMLRGKAKPEDRRQVLAAAAEAGVTVIETLMSRSDSLALIDACDCYVSLHRSEGFGLPLAEAMLLGKPVIATAYSGNMDFMTGDNSLLVDYQRVELEQDMAPYPRGGVWARPSERHAAELMRQVYEDPGRARDLGDRARREVGERLGLAAAGERMARRLRELARGD